MPKAQAETEITRFVLPEEQVLIHGFDCMKETEAQSPGLEGSGFFGRLNRNGVFSLPPLPVYEVPAGAGSGSAVPSHDALRGPARGLRARPEVRGWLRGVRGSGVRGRPPRPAAGRASSQVRGGGGADRCLPPAGGGGGCRGLGLAPAGVPGGRGLCAGSGHRPERGVQLKNSSKKSQPAPDGRVEGWVFAGEMRGLCLQLAYKVPVLGSQNLPASQRAKTERGGAAARGRSRRDAGARPGGAPAGVTRAALAAVPGSAAFPALGPAGVPGSPRAGRRKGTELVLRKPRAPISTTGMDVFF
ncbi:translation initiation factor IF-2-like [Grus americana]|uniref:translation initiation factor IF-2-like n=1 Tax=Grus americana TaxID=9117 RepID=UPI0024086D92|nr:translation initiation factor IF-2-like [Grus americana]